MSKLFHLARKTDPTGVSGTGIVADGVEFPDGVCVIRWRGGDAGYATTATHDNLSSVVAIHGHDGATEVVFE